MPAIAADVVGFWTAAGPSKWFAKSPIFDEAIRLKFEPTHHYAALGRYMAWAETPQGALALMILLDQFPRNLYRGTGHAYATDPLARSIARRALDAGHDQASPPQMRPFFYLPFSHSEDAADQDLSVALFEAHDAATGDFDSLKWAGIHHDIIQRFGRFPHRNLSLGRDSTPEELAFMEEGDFAG